VGLFFAAFAGLGLDSSTGSSASSDFVARVPWAVWRGVAAAAVVLFVVLLLTGARVLANSSAWGLAASRGRVWAYVATAAAGVALLLLILRLGAGAGNNPDLPVKALELRTGAVLLSGLTASIPWLAVVWLALDCCRALRHRIASLPPVTAHQGMGAVAPEAATRPGPYPEAITGLLELWRLLLLCVGAFTLGVVAAIVTSSALRGAFLAAYPERAAEFPAVNVLYYGALFAGLLTMLAAPVAVTWRAGARDIVERAHPLPVDGQPTEQWVEARHRMETLLHLDVPLLRNPLTALTVLTPLLTSALAAFLPQLGSP
jgi:hypothetical protein